jgi:hypothetical protein
LSGHDWEKRKGQGTWELALIIEPRFCLRIGFDGIHDKWAELEAGFL